MRCLGMSSYSVLFAHLTLAAVLFFAGLSTGDETSESLFTDGSASSSSNTQASSRSKRAPGWGKRSDNILDDELYESDAAEDLINSVQALKRAPGWGKRFSDASSVAKRAPGWGKRFADADKLDMVENGLDEEKRAPGWGKRAPGWGKRSSWVEKRAPGWGKRSSTSRCKMLEESVDIFLAQAVKADTQRIAECGSWSHSNELQRK